MLPPTSSPVLVGVAAIVLQCFRFRFCSGFASTELITFETFPGSRESREVKAVVALALQKDQRKRPSAKAGSITALPEARVVI